MEFNWFSFLLYILIGAFTPGPNNIMSMNNAKHSGFRKGMVFILGMQAGVLVIMILCMVFSAALASVIPRVQFPMKIAGASYMVYLAARTLFPPKANRLYDGSGSFAVGAVLQFLNPKLIFYGITAISSFILPFYSGAAVLSFFVFILTIAGFFANMCWALFGSLFSVLFTKYDKAVNAVMALLLLYCAVSLFL